MTLMGLPIYPHADAYPYHIAVNIPRADKIHAQLYGFGVDDPLPRLQIPLSGDEGLPFDFNAVYQFTFRAGRWDSYVDYEQPLTETSYRQNDRERLDQLRLGILQTHQAG